MTSIFGARRWGNVSQYCYLPEQHHIAGFAHSNVSNMSLVFSKIKSLAEPYMSPGV